MNNPSPNLTTVYLDTPLVGPTPEPLEYVPSPVCLRKLVGIPLLVQEVAHTPVVPKGVPLPHLHRTVLAHGCIPPTGQAQLRRVVQPATGP